MIQKNKTYLALTLFTFLFGGKIMHSQNITPFVINSTGSTQIAGSGILNFNVGESAVSKISNGSYTITQGFLQPVVFTTAVAKQSTNNSWQVYPNPATNVLNLNPLNYKEAVWARVIDNTGKEVLYTEAVNNTVSLSGLNAGLYQVQILNAKKEILATKQIAKL
jgi:hypothetical protein